MSPSTSLYITPAMPQRTLAPEHPMHPDTPHNAITLTPCESNPPFTLAPGAAKDGWISTCKEVPMTGGTLMRLYPTDREL
ncbi:MAG: hypothetical protein ACK5XN_37655, partial [Bacteroidota bacterium]